MTKIDEDMLLNAIKNIKGDGTLGEKLLASPGDLFFSSSDLLRDKETHNKIMIMGLNPGGDPKSESVGSLGSNISKYWDDDSFKSYSGFIDRCWHSKADLKKAGHHKEPFHHYTPSKTYAECPICSKNGGVVPVGMQRVMQELFQNSVIKVDLRKSITLNAIFMQSIRGSVDLKDNSLIANYSNHSVSNFFKEYLYPIHKIILGIVKPKLVLCLGHGDQSPFSLFRRAIEPNPQQERDSCGATNSAFWKYFNYDGIHFLGIHHPA
ncbi:hypothetical protein EHQ71_18305 [Leptospira levettii]|uniref:hypothetical protein n=1 Tax=Leptospira levettii TaxID=2023178 RepID=UPI0010835BA1|nr:hypothetical protein [Leptospira levettii]TGM26147.1 hypothetical protein EHQ71_18305 [Leptospira levettii]